MMTNGTDAEVEEQATPKEAAYKLQPPD